MTYVKKNLTKDDITTYESMYESPFSLKISEMCDEIAKFINDDVDTAVMRSIADIGINVDKEELIKALQYDRDQYNKGYSDGARFGFEAGKPKWIPVSEELPGDGEWAIFTDGNQISIERYKMDALDHFFPDGRWFNLEDAVAWTPLPAPYEPQESEKADGQNNEH